MPLRLTTTNPKSSTSMSAYLPGRPDAKTLALRSDERLLWVGRVFLHRANDPSHGCNALNFGEVILAVSSLYSLALEPQVRRQTTRAKAEADPETSLPLNWIWLANPLQ